jgi:hypothetical protein
MNIEMKTGEHPTKKESQVWWWQIVEDGERVSNGVGWEYKKETAYASAMKSMRAARARRSVDVSTD